MPIQNFQLSDDFVNEEQEAALLKLIQQYPGQWKHFRDRLELRLFAVRGDDFEQMRAQQEGQQDEQRDDEANPEVEGLLGRLEELSTRRGVADFQARIGAMLFGETAVDEMLGAIRREAEGLARFGPRKVAAVRSAFELGQGVVAMAHGRAELRKATGKPVGGIPIGLTQLDRMLNGWNVGLHVVAAGPGVGKTTLCLQFGWQAAKEGYPVLYVSYENSVDNLVLKLLCSQCGQSPAEIERGLGEYTRLQGPMMESAAILDRLHFIEGNSRLEFGSLESTLQRISRLSGGKTPLLVFDYLQRAAHTLGYQQLRHNVSMMTAQLRELGQRTNSAVLAISSLNRAGGDYGRGGAAQLDSLKESGDLEYGADTVMLLYPPAESTATAPAREVELKLAKNRFGPVGSLRLIFRPDLGVFRERV